MTGRTITAIAGPMLRHAWFLVLCLLASSLVATASVHAQEGPGAAEICCAGTPYAEGAADQALPDGDQPIPHHHGACHGHSLTGPVVSSMPLPMTTVRAAPEAWDTSRLARRVVGPALEPPRA